MLLPHLLADHDGMWRRELETQCCPHRSQRRALGWEQFHITVLILMESLLQSLLFHFHLTFIWNSSNVIQDLIRPSFWLLKHQEMAWNKTLNPNKCQHFKPVFDMVLKVSLSLGTIVAIEFGMVMGATASSSPQRSSTGSCSLDKLVIHRESNLRICDFSSKYEISFVIQQKSNWRISDQFLIYLKWIVILCSFM